METWEEVEEKKTNDNEKEDEKTLEPLPNVIWDISRGIIDDDEEKVEEICMAQTRRKATTTNTISPYASYPVKKTSSNSKTNSRIGKSSLVSIIYIMTYWKT